MKAENQYLDVSNRLKLFAAEVLSQDPGDEGLLRSSFVQLGGDSLLAMRLAARARVDLGVSLRVGSLLDDRALIDALAMAEIVNTEMPSPSDEGSNKGVSSGQHGMWVMQQLVGGSASNLVFLSFFDGPINIASVQEAIEGTVRRHDGLRTCFRSGGDGLYREVLDEFTPQVDVVAFDGHSANFHDEAQRLAQKRGAREFRLAEVPPIEFVCITDGQDKHSLVLITHHMLLDGWAIGLVLNEIFDRLEALVSGRQVVFSAPPTQDAFIQYHESLRQTGVIMRQLQYWEATLQDVPTTLELASDHPRPSRQNPSGARLPYHLTGNETTAVYRQAANLHVTPFALLLATFSLLLARYTGQRKMVVGIPSAGRPTPELRQLVGLCTNLVPVVINVYEDQPLGDFVRDCQRSLNRSLDNADVPFDQVVRAAGVNGECRHNPLIQYVFGMHDQLIPRERTVGKAHVTIEDGHAGGSPFDLSMFVQYTTPFMSGELEYADSIFSQPEMRAFIANYLSVVSALLDDAAQCVENVRGIAPGQIDRMRSMNQTATAFRQNTVEHLFSEQVTRTPDAVAVKGPGGPLTYRDLARASTYQANELIRAGVQPDDFVIVGLERSALEIVAVLAVLKAGATYVAIDSQWPDSRLQKVIEVTLPTAIMAHGQLADRLSHLTQHPIPTVPLWNRDWNGQAPDLPLIIQDPNRICYVAFTSGSTGEPKGVAVRHRGVVRLVDDVDYTECGRDERWLRFVPLSFDPSTLEIWGPLLNGGTCIIFPPGLPAPAEMSEFLVREDVTRLWLTSGLFRVLSEFAPEGFGKLRQLLTGGDVVPAEQVRKILSMHPALTITNGYGPTENTTFTTTFTAKSAAGVENPLPIGRPVPNTRCYVLDYRHRLVPPGAIGELYVGGDGLAAGYLNNTDETSRRFRPFSPDVDEILYSTGDMVRIDSHDQIQFLGRNDHQVKIRGYRVELEEVRAAILKFPGVVDAVVVTVGTTSSDRRLVGAVVTKDNNADTLPNLKDFLASQLPKYMMPAQWAIVEQIPLTQNGKVDAQRLSSLAISNPISTLRSNHLSKSSVHASVRHIMEKILDRSGIGDDENFIELGGDSLSMARLIAQVRQEVGVDLPLQAFYAQPTLARMVELLEQAPPSKVLE